MYQPPCHSPQVEHLDDIRFKGFNPKECLLRTVTCLEQVRCGTLNSLQYRNGITTDLASSQLLSDTTLDITAQSSSYYVTTADLDNQDHRYLLCGQNDGGVAIYDTGTTNGKMHPMIGNVKGGQKGSHKYQVDSVQWYPADTGLFTTSSRDDRIKIWDPNKMKVVDQFKIDSHINHHHMSPVASKHSLIAVAGYTGEVVLCDLRSGSHSHRLFGHIGPVQYLQWAPRNENCLASGGRDQTIRLWDVRSGKSCLKILDKDNSPPTSSRKSSSKHKCPVAHKGRVSSLCYTHDGLWLLSYGQDGKLMVWDSSSGENKNIKFGKFIPEIKRQLKMTVSQGTSPDLVYLPGRAHVLVFNVLTGALVNVLRGHFAPSVGVVYNPLSMHLYSYGNDRNVIVWIPKLLLKDNNLMNEEVEKYVPKSNSTSSQSRVVADCWSSDDD